MAQVSYGTITITDTNDIESIVVEYARNQSTTNAPTSGWSTTRPAWAQGYYIWQRTRIHKSGTQDSEDTFGTAVCLTGSTGQTGSQGPQGETGATGQSLSSTKTQYTNAASNVTITTSNHTSYTWTDNVPAYNSSKPVYWCRVTNTYINPSKTEYIVYKDQGTTDAIKTSNDANSTANSANTKADNAVNTANSANQTANQTQTNLNNYISSNDAALSALQTKTKYFWRNLVAHTNGSSGWTKPNYPVGTYAASGISGTTFDEENSSTYGYNTLYANGIKLRYNAINLGELTGSSLTFYRPSTTSQGSKGMELTSSTLKFYDATGTVAQATFGGTQATISGTINVYDGKIGNNANNYWYIGNYTDYNQNSSAIIKSKGTASIQLNETNTWRISTNRIHTAWAPETGTDAFKLHFPKFNDSGSVSKYWDYGLHLPTSYSDKFLYIRNASGSETLDNLLNDLDDSGYNYWNYKFYIDGEGNIHAGDIYSHDVLISGTSAPYLLKSGGTITGNLEVNGTLTKGGKNVAYFPSTPTSGQILVADGTGGSIKTSGYTIAKSVPSNAVFTDQYVQTVLDNSKKLYLTGTQHSGTYTGTLNYNANVYVEGDALNASTILADSAQLGDLIVTGAGRFANGLYGDLIGNADTATKAAKVADSRNGADITLNYSGTNYSTTSWFAAWNGYQLGAISPANVLKTIGAQPAGSYVSKTGDTMSGDLTVPTIKVNSVVNEGYAHRIDFGRSSVNQMDFYEYGGVYNFYRNTNSANTDNATLLGKITINGWEGNVVGNVTGNASTATTLQTGKNITIGNKTNSFNGSSAISYSLADIGAVNKTGDTMTGDLVFDSEKSVNYKIRRKQAEGGGWAYSPIRAIGNDNSIFANIGFCGQNDTLSYMYLGSGEYGSANNLRIYPNGTVSAATFSGSLSGNATSATTATKLNSTRSFTIGKTTKNVDWSGTVSFSQAEISDNASTTAAGWMSVADKKKLDSITVSDIGTIGANSIRGEKDIKVTISSGIATIGHENAAITAGTISGTATSTLSNGGSFKIPSITYDAYGHITGTAQTTITLPNITSVSGNAGTATKFSSARAISLSGDVSGSATADGSSGWSISTRAYYLTHALSRPASANVVNTDHLRQIYSFLASSSMTEGKPLSDGTIIHFSWDNNGWAGQLYIPNSKNLPLQFRGGNNDSGNTSWEDWKTILDSSNFDDYALPLTGGTLTGDLIVGTTDSPANIQIGAKNDNYGLLPSVNNYNQIGKSGMSWYRAYITNYYGLNSMVTNWRSGNNIGYPSTSSANAERGKVNFYNDCTAGSTQTKTLLEASASATSNITLTLPNKTGTIALTSDNVASATTATYSYYPKFVANNELRFDVNSKPSSAINLCVSYKWSDGTSDAKITRYNFYNGGTGLAEIGASTFHGDLSGNATSATKAAQDGSGNVITSTYLKLSGGTMTGAINLPYNKQSVSFRSDNASYDSGFVYGTGGNEALALVQQNAVTSFMVVHGSDPATWTTSTWNSSSPTLQTKNNSLYVHELIPSSTTPSYNFKVNGSSYLGGEVKISDTNADTASVSMVYDRDMGCLNFIFN